MTFDESIEAFRRGRFEIDLLRITLRQDGAAEPEDFTGPGTVRQGEDGRIELKCHASLPADRDMFANMSRDMNRKSGEVFLDDDHFQCSAVDLWGEAWEGGRLLIHPSWSMPLNAGTIYAHATHLRRAKDVRGGRPRLRLIFFKQEHKDWKALLGPQHSITLVNMPVSFTLQATADREDQVTVQIEAEQGLPQAFERRLVEALQFVLAQSLQVAISDQTNTSSRVLELRSAVARDWRANPYPPLATHTTQFSAGVVELLRLYLDFLYAWPDEDMWHPCTAYLALVRNANAMSLDAWALTLGVAVEGMARLIDYDPVANVEAHDRFRAAASTWMDTESISDELRLRVLGMLSQLDHVRPSDLMKSLIPAGHALHDDIKAWTRLRNKAVHTRQVTRVDVLPDRLQQSIDEVHAVTRLLYAIVFHHIAYSGPYTDYAERGFPERQFPFAVEPAKASD